MFHLHSSADHAFVITRRSKQGYSFSGPDEAVSWEAVRTVKYLVPTEYDDGGATNACPICLDSFTCPRITKCGHSFCLSCLLRHVHTQAETNTSQAVKCPCCGLPIHLNDTRLVTFESIQPPRLQGKMTLTKLHRTKECPAPYLPQRGALKHSSPHAAPTSTDRDALFSRFNYVDPDLYLSQLAANKVELESSLAELQPQQSHHSSVAMEMIFVSMALESVKAEERKAIQERAEEQTLAEQYRQPHAGMYQMFSDKLFATEALKELHMSNPRTRPSRTESIDSTDSTGQTSRGKLPNLEATMYLDKDSTQFYQSSDGQLCFLSRFNMSCLLSEFTAHVPEIYDRNEVYPSELRRLRPLPDVIQGVVLENENIHLTPDVRKRMPFLSHLPVYTDIHFVELDLNNILSAETKQKFKSEMENRRKKRKNKVAADKRADRAAKQKEEARINELRSRIQRIDPNDEFFQSSIPEEPTVLMGEEFGPAISEGAVDRDTIDTRPHSQPQMSFSAVTVSNLNPMAVTEDAFPSLSSSPSSGQGSRTTNPTWSSPPGWHGRPRAKTVEEGGLPEESAPTKRGRKGKKKVHLFSTGGYRGTG